MDFLDTQDCTLYFNSENPATFQELEALKEQLTEDDCLIVSQLSSLGENKSDVLNQLDWFIRKPRRLLVSNLPTTYQYGIEPSTNQAVLATLSQSILSQSSNVLALSSYESRRSRGRPKIPFPDNWERLYRGWKDKRISSQDFLTQSGLKKATFYNMLADYEGILKDEKDFCKKYKIG